MSAQKKEAATARRRAYRERNKVPCEGCGTPVEGKGRSNTRTGRYERVKLDPNRPYLCKPCALGWKPRDYAEPWKISPEEIRTFFLFGEPPTRLDARGVS
jgi:hypothetical protein